MANTVSNGSEKSAVNLLTTSSPQPEEVLLGSVRGINARHRQMAPLSALELHSAVSALSELEGVTVKKKIAAPGQSPLAATQGEAGDVIVAHMNMRSRQILEAQSQNRLIIEQNAPLDYAGMSLFGAPGYLPPADYAAIPQPVKVKIRILGKGDKPLANARVMLQGIGMMQNGVSDNKGEVTLDLWTMDGAPAKSLWVKPRADHWDMFLERPNLVDSQVNVVRLEAFTETNPGFPAHFGVGWGLEAMGLTGRPDFARGKGVKVAIIDSGCDAKHPILSHVRHGKDVSSEGLDEGWKNDSIGHGTHVAGIITGNGGKNGTGLTGFVPEAEVHVLKVFPGGYDSLIEAINYCILNKIDVINMSLGGPQISIHVEQAIQDATAAGIACIVAAGNSGDGVKYPASSHNTLAVAAVGNLSKTPNRSWGKTQVVADSMANDGIFSAKFSCHGPEITLCAPGVAIVSSLPGGDYGTDDGTSMASPHVTGLAALILAHSPFFRSAYKTRNADRVAALFALLRNMCRPYSFTEGRAGAGFPALSGNAFQGWLPAVDPALDVNTLPAATPPANGRAGANGAAGGQPHAG